MPWLVRDGEVLATLEIAESSKARARGLLGRDDFDGALLLRPAKSVHTIGMRFAIDVVFLARDGEVVKVVPSLRPWRTAAARRAKAVLELPAGEADRRRIRPGIRLDLSLSADPSS